MHRRKTHCYTSLRILLEIHFVNQQRNTRNINADFFNLRACNLTHLIMRHIISMIQKLSSADLSTYCIFYFEGM